MSKLPPMAYADGIRKYKSVTFGGYDHRLGAENGTLWDMENMTSDYYPLLGSRRPRYACGTVTKPNGFYCHDGLYWVDGNTLYRDGTSCGALAAYETDVRRTFASLGIYIVILPDKMIYDTMSDTLADIDCTLALTGATIRSGTYVEEPAVGNTIDSATVDFSDYFKVGDAVRVTGSTGGLYDLDKPIIIREIGQNSETQHYELRFWENTFFDDPEQTPVTGQSLTIERSMPQLDFICENENRLWGCAGDMIYASKWADPYNWDVSDGLASDSYQLQVGSAGDFTGCCSYLGYPCFFKEEHIYKVYGDRPGNYQVMGSASLGVAAGSHQSFGIAGEILFYLARTGIVAYSGGIPQSISAVFGTERYRDAVGGSDGIKYYVSMQDTSDEWHLFVYDTASGLWHREDGLQAVGFGWNGELYFLDADGTLWLNGNAREQPTGSTVEEPLLSMAEFGDFTELESSRSGAQPNKKGTAKLQVRIELEADSEVTISIKFDSTGEWETVTTLGTHVKRSYYLPIIPRRSDHFRIKFTGTGQWRLYSLVREHYIGSEL